MRRLLHGRFLYIGLGLLVAVLYVKVLHTGSTRAPGIAPHLESAEADHMMMEKTRTTEEWWPASLDANTLKQLTQRHPSLGMVMMLLTVFVTGMGLGGILLALWGLWTGRIRAVWQYRSRRLPRWSFGELGRIIALILILASLMPFVRLALLSYRPEWDLDLHLWLSVSMFFLDVVLILIILVFALEKGASVWSVLGLSTRRLFTSIEVGFRGYVAVFPWLFLLLFLVLQLAHALGIEPPVEPIQALLFEETRPVVIGITGVLACVVGPIAEELFFRGVVYSVLRQRTSRVVAMLISGTVFAAIHMTVVGFLPILVLGCLLADLYERTGSLASPLAVHILHNSFLVVLAMVFRALMMPT